MNADPGVSTARRYLLGQSGEDECAAIENEYFANEAVVDRIAAVEEDLVEDYLAGRLQADDRRQFESYYLASPQHQARVETIRRLSALSEDDRFRTVTGVESPAGTRSLRYLALAAGILIAAGALWTIIPHRPPAATSVATQPAPAPAPALPVPAARQIFAVSLSPIAVRSASDSQNVVVPAGTDVVALQLEGGANPATATNARAVIQTVAGDEVWRGLASSSTDLPAGTIARFEVPASRLGIDDYIVILFDTDAAGTERERNRYVLRARSR